MNKTGTHGYMKAPDLFIKDAKQVFDRKTGAYICLQQPGQDVKDLFTPDPVKEKEIENPNQIKLF